MNLDMKWGFFNPLRGAQGEGSETRLFEFFCPRTLAQNLGCTFASRSCKWHTLGKMIDCAKVGPSFACCCGSEEAEEMSTEEGDASGD